MQRPAKPWTAVRFRPTPPSTSYERRAVRNFLNKSRIVGIFYLPGLSLLVGFGVLPICLAIYMSVHRWRPIQGRYVGAGHYEKALGDITSGLLVLGGFSVMIIGVWMLVRNWRDQIDRKILYLAFGVLLFFIMAVAARAVQLYMFAREYELGSDSGLELASSYFLDKNGDPQEQLLIVGANIRSLIGSFLVLVMSSCLLWFVVVRQKKLVILARISSVFLFYGAAQVVSIGWAKMTARGDTDFLDSLIHTVFYSIGTITMQVSLGLIIAFALYRKLRGFAIFRFLIFLPYVVPVVAMATVFRLIYGERESSLSNQLLSFIGIEPLRWIADSTPVINYFFGLELGGLFGGPSLGMVTVILFGVFSYTGYNAVILLAGLTSIPTDLYEAAEIEGASAWQTFRFITMPLLSPVIFFLVITGLIGTFQAFTHIYIMLGPIVNETIHTGVITIWREIELGKFGYASALAVILFILIILLTISQFSLFSRQQEFGE